MINKNLIELVRKNENSFIELFSNKITINEHLFKYNDPILKDMYDHNCFYTDHILSKDDINTAFSINKESFIKFESEVKQPIIESEFEIENISCLIHIGKIEFDINPNLSFKFLSLDDISFDLYSIESKHYDHIYGADFVKRKMYHYFSKVKTSNLDFLGVYLDKKIVGSCYIYKHDGVIGVDGLLVDCDYRHKRIASSILSFIINNNDENVYLHADIDDWMINMYRKMGFIDIDTKYYYFKDLKAKL